MKILIYDDNPDFGGHQIMACRGAGALSEISGNEVLFMLNPENEKLIRQLDSTNRIQVINTEVNTRKAQGLRNVFCKKNIRNLEKQFSSLSPDLILCIQGDLEGSSQAVLAAANTGIECISYIAIPHTLRTMKASGGNIRDRINQALLNKPDRYITISESMQSILKKRGVTNPITIVPNGIPASSLPSRDLHTDHPVIGLIGRIEFKQKQQHLLVQAFNQYPDAFRNAHLLFAGSGPDEQKLKNLINDNSRMQWMPWTESIDTFYEKIDFLVIPSRFEGVPLVMLEALARGIPCFGSATDGMKDLLRKSWTFETGNARALAQTFEHIRTNWEETLPRLQEKVRNEHSLEAFRSNFVKAVTTAGVSIS